MKILSIETTTNIGSVAFLENEILKKEIIFQSDDIAGELTKEIDSIYEDFDYITVSSGPGSWTGIRVGISFAKGLTLGKTEKIYCVNIFDSFFNAVKNFKKHFLCIVSFSKEKFYFSNFKGNFNYRKVSKVEIIDLRDLLHIIKKNKNCFIIGPGIIKLKEFIDISQVKTIELLWYPRASLNGILAYQKIKRKIPSLPLEPIYGK